MSNGSTAAINYGKHLNLLADKFNFLDKVTVMNCTVLSSLYLKLIPSKKIIFVLNFNHIYKQAYTLKYLYRNILIQFILFALNLGLYMCIIFPKRNAISCKININEKIIFTLTVLFFLLKKL